MRIISLNVALFEENNTKLKQLLEEQKPDIICLQEVTKRVDKTAFAKFVSKDSIDEVTQNLKYSFFAPCSVMKNFEYKNFHTKKEFSHDLGGFVEFGNYVKSSFKIIKGQNIFVQNHFSLTTDWSKWPEDNSKAAQVIDLKLQNEQKLRVINYHGIWSRYKKDSPLTIKAAKTIKKYAQEVDYPVIICGDFNLFPNTKSMLILKKGLISLVDEFNIKTTRPSSNELSGLKRNIVDYIFISKVIKVNKFEVLDSDASDHLPLILDFDIYSV